MTPKLRPTNPPSKLSDRPVTGPEAPDPLIAPPFAPMKPPTQLFGPLLLTAPEAVEFVIVAAMLVTPTSPPRMLLPPPLTAPVAELLLTVPSLEPVNPPARLAAPTVTPPVA